MSTSQSEPQARHGGTLDGARPPSSITASPNGDSPRPDLPLPGLGPSSSPGPTGEIITAARVDARRPAISRAPLTGTDLYDWMALRRVNDGGITRMDDRWFDSGRRVPGYVADTLTTLCDSGLVVLAEWDMRTQRRAALTDTGTLRYQQLSQLRETIRPLPAGESAPTGTWLADHPLAHNMVRSVWEILAELEQAGHHPGVITALRRVLTYHEPTSRGRCRVCRRWRGRRRRFPCIVWHQIHTALRAS